ncbi:unnamed protein product [Cladocopium goreaui]|uniref:Probable phospholipase C20G8.02, mitochondrial n=1 Tax=Cladocopium goreaui TaxID=2562237 RepID=A0A9P1G5L6_9DINO|nr:unnamed protein product [Cladocopium goreaui]
MDGYWVYLERGVDAVRRWKAFGAADQRRLEANVVVFFGRAAVHLPRHGTSGSSWLVARYGGGCLQRFGPFPVRRATWFRLPSGQLEPYGEKMNRKLNTAYEKLASAQECTPASAGSPRSDDVTSPSGGSPSAKGEIVRCGKKVVRMYVTWGKIQAAEKETDGTMRTWLGLSHVLVQRGCEVPVEEEEELLLEKVGQIVVVVHGIGEKFAQSHGRGLAYDIGVLRSSLLHCQLKRCGFVQQEGRWQAGEGAQPGQRIEVLVSEWWQGVHSEEMDRQLDSITLPSLSAVRDFANLSLVDGLAFFQERQKVMAATAANIERSVGRFKECNPDFRGQIFLVGHSLGGVILWDIVTEKRLSFTPSALFTLGSPLGVFLHTAHGVAGAENMREKLGKVPFFNIFHPLDPVAYRVEPLLLPELTAEPPAPVEEPHGAARRRMDWVLPSVAMSSAAQLLQAVPSHITYYQNPHVASFILRQCVHSPASLSHVAQAAREQLSVRRSRKSGSRVDGNEEKGGGGTLWLCQNSY